MSIDWFTVIAQIINFLILVWLLKRFLYQPILDAIDAREQRIADELKSADTKQSEAQKQRDEFVQKNAEFEKQKQILMQQANDAAKKERTRLIAAARQQADTLEIKQQHALERQQQNLQAQLRSLASDEVFAICRNVLTDLAGTHLEQSITEAFIGRLQAIEGEAKQAFINAVSDTSLSSDHQQHIRVCSAFDLPPQQKAAIKAAINKMFSADIPLQFETAANVIGGIKLHINGQQISWSIDEYLTSLEKNVAALLQAVDITSSAPKPPAIMPEASQPETVAGLPSKSKSTGTVQ